MCTCVKFLFLFVVVVVVVVVVAATVIFNTTASIKVTFAQNSSFKEEIGY